MARTPTTVALAVTIAASLALSGCATPYVVKLPKTQPPQSSRSIEKALEYLQTMREPFRDAVEAQIADEHSASNAFIVAGALVTGLALGKVHRDGVLVATGAAGTGYALANNNLPRSRLQIHQDVVKALDCAERAALPLFITDAESNVLSTDVEELRAVRLRLSAALGEARAVRATVKQQDPFVGAFTAAEKIATETLDQTAQSVKAAEAFLDATPRAAQRLTTAVNTIRTSGIHALGEATPPLSAIPPLVQGLAKDMGLFAPGAGIDTSVADSLKKSIAGGKAMTGVESKSPLGTAVEALEAALRDTVTLQAPINAALRGRNTTFAEDAFKDCTVTQVVTALAVTPASVKFSAGTGGQRILELKGGVKPYFLQLDGDPVPGLTFPTGPIRGGEAEIALKAGAGTGGLKTGLRASDSSAAGQGVRIEVEIAAAEAPASGASAPKPTAATAKPAAIGIDNTLALLKKKSKFVSGGANFQTKELPVKVGDHIEVTVLCPDGNTKVFKRADLAKSYLSTVGAMGFPAEKLAVTTEPASCAPS